jgi:hypothetical protein
MITIGSSSTLQLSIPAPSEKNWASNIRTGCFQKISDHNHQGTGGTGSKLTGYLALDLTTAIITNDTWLFSRNSANTANLKILKVASDNISINIGDTDTPSSTTTRVGSLILGNNVSLTAINAAQTAAINLLKLNTSNQIEIGADTQPVLIKGVKEINASTTAVTLADNQSSAADTTMVSALSAHGALIIKYKVQRNSLTQTGTLTVDYDANSIANEYVGTKVGITFSLSSNLIKYTTTSTGFAPSLTYTIRRI